MQSAERGESGKTRMRFASKASSPNPPPRTRSPRGRSLVMKAFVVRETDGSIAYVESKFSPGASYQQNQVKVYPEMVKDGDAGLVAEVGPRTGGGQLIRGQKIRVQFRGDVWNGAGKLHGQ